MRWAAVRGEEDNCEGEGAAPSSFSSPPLSSTASSALPLVFLLIWACRSKLTWIKCFHFCHHNFLKQDLTIKAAGLNPGNIGTLWEVGCGEKIFCRGCSSSESDSLCFEDTSISSKKQQNKTVGTCGQSLLRSVVMFKKGFSNLWNHWFSNLGFHPGSVLLGKNVTDVIDSSSYSDLIWISVHCCQGEEWSSRDT